MSQALAVSAMSPRLAGERLRDLQENIERVFQGKARVVRLTLACVLARGHLLLEDVPGVGKTTLGLAVARSLGLKFQRVQFTSDLLPADIVGVSIFNQQRAEFEFRPGPVFAGVVLADEINRTTPRTQSALLEAMSEGRVSVDNVTHTLPKPFLVIATQNPLEHHGTYPLPESQLDRFLMRLSVGYPASSVERNILLGRGLEQPVEQVRPVVDAEELLAMQQLAAQVRMDDSLVDYVLKVVEATREDRRVRIGVSTRGALGLVAACRAYALVQGREYCVPEDVRELLVPCLAHRLSLGGASSPLGSRQQAEALVEDLAARIPVPT